MCFAGTTELWLIRWRGDAWSVQKCPLAFCRLFCIRSFWVQLKASACTLQTCVWRFRTWLRACWIWQDSFSWDHWSWNRTQERRHPRGTCSELCLRHRSSKSVCRGELREKRSAAEHLSNSANNAELLLADGGLPWKILAANETHDFRN